MNKDAIRKTAVCRWDPKGKCFIVQSPLYDTLLGAAASAAEAWDIFDDFLDDAYVSYLEGRLGGMYAKRGRPAKNRTGIHCEVKRETRDELRSLAEDLGCSQGEVVDYLTAFVKAAKSVEPEKAKFVVAEPGESYSVRRVRSAKSATKRRRTRG